MVKRDFYLSWQICQCYAKKEGIEMFVKAVFGVILIFAFCFAFQGVPLAKEEQENLFKNPSFEEGTANWKMDTDVGTVANYTVDKKDAIDGKQSALVTIDAAAGWGSQFGQNVVAGENGKTCTFAVLAKSVDGPVTVNLQVERAADPWDRALRSDMFTLKDNEWTELHATFKVNDAFPQGWFAYISCTQAKAKYRVDIYRLYEGEYIPYEELEKPKPVSASVNDLITTWGRMKAK